MGTVFWLKCLGIRFFCNENSRKKFLTINILKSFNLKTMLIFEKIFSKDFDVFFYNHLFESSLFKKNFLLTQYLTNKVDLSIKKNKREILSPLHNSILTNNLKESNYYSWLAIIASHSSLHLIGLEKQYVYEDYYDFIKTFILHNKFSSFFTSIETQQLILKNCHSNAVKMFEFIFMDLKLKKTSDKKPSKVVKI